MAATPHLQRTRQQTLGADAAGDLVAWIESMDAHGREISELRRTMEVGFARIDERFARVDGRIVPPA